MIVEAFKIAHDVQNTFCIRLYESFGGGAQTGISFGFEISKVEICNGLEEIIPSSEIPLVGNSFSTKFKPFEIKSFLPIPRERQQHQKP